MTSPNVQPSAYGSRLARCRWQRRLRVLPFDFGQRNVCMNDMASAVSSTPSSRWQRIAPAFTLVLISPLVAEVLPGATPLHAMFVFPIEMCVWGGGALLIRSAVRRWQLGWRNMLLLALGLSIAEECLIQQTSFAPLVIQLQGMVYARAFGVNYVYFLWAIVYESAFVVFLPIYLVELIYPTHRADTWISKLGLAVTIVFFLIGSVFAWFTWTHIARVKVFKLPLYNPPVESVLIAAATICALIFAAIGPFRNTLARPSAPLKPPPPWVLAIMGAVWAILWYGLVLLAFGIHPTFPPAAAASAGLLLTTAVLLVVPRCAVDSRFQTTHEFALIFGTMLGSMFVGFIRFIGAAPVDLYFKIVVNILAVALLITLGIKVLRQMASTARLKKIQRI